MTVPTHSTDHVARGKQRLLGQFRKPKIEALLASYLEQVQDLEDAAYELLIYRYLPDAEGEQLTVLGRLVGQPRTSSDDTEYRAALAARIAINRSSGAPEDIIKVARAMLSVTGEAFEYGDEYPGQVRVTVTDPIVNDPFYLVRFLDEARAAGVRLLLQYHTHPSGESLVLGWSGGYPGSGALDWSGDPGSFEGKLDGTAEGSP